MTSRVYTGSDASTVERRKSGRVPFGALLAVSEYQGGRLPSASVFRKVKAINLSQTGIAFTSSEWPASDQLVLMFGDPARPLFVVMRIVGCSSKGRAIGERCFEVRGEFVEWVSTRRSS